MDIIKDIRLRASQRQKLIVLPEKDDPRVCEAARIIKEQNIARIILLGKEDLDPKKIDSFAGKFYELRKARGITEEEARTTVSMPLYYASMLVREGEADGFVAGSVHATADVARAAIYCLGIEEGISTISSCFIMVVPNCPLGDNGVFIYADCGIVPDPSARQLSHIAISTADLAKKVFNIVPRVAMLSYSTKGSASGKLVDKVKLATQMAKEQAPDLLIDGELQLDSAIVPEVAAIKDPNGVLGGRANVLIFPSLDAGNIGYKLTQRLAGARAVGPLLQGIKKPCSDLSRGCIPDDIVDCVAVTALRA